MGEPGEITVITPPDPDDLTYKKPGLILQVLHHPRLEGRIAREEGPAHGPPLCGWDQFGHRLPVVQMRNVADVGGDEPIGQAIHLRKYEPIGQALDD